MKPLRPSTIVDNESRCEVRAGGGGGVKRSEMKMGVDDDEAIVRTDHMPPLKESGRREGSIRRVEFRLVHSSSPPRKNQERREKQEETERKKRKAKAFEEKKNPKALVRVPDVERPRGLAKLWTPSPPPLLALGAAAGWGCSDRRRRRNTREEKDAKTVTLHEEAQKSLRLHHLPPTISPLCLVLELDGTLVAIAKKPFEIPPLEAAGDLAAHRHRQWNGNWLRFRPYLDVFLSLVFDILQCRVGVWTISCRKMSLATSLVNATLGKYATRVDFIRTRTSAPRLVRNLDLIWATTPEWRASRTVFINVVVSISSSSSSSMVVNGRGRGREKGQKQQQQHERHLLSVPRWNPPRIAAAAHPPPPAAISGSSRRRGSSNRSTGGSHTSLLSPPPSASQSDEGLTAIAERLAILTASLDVRNVPPASSSSSCLIM